MNFRELLLYLGDMVIGKMIEVGCVMMCVCIMCMRGVLGQRPVEYVNTFIGTGGHGHTYPGATMPYGMVQIGPDTRLEGWDGCSGYHYSDDEIYGFSHTHLSGTGIADYCDVLIMPQVGKPYMNNGLKTIFGYKSPFAKETEHAFPGYYSVILKKGNVKAEMSATERVGMHRYTFEDTSKQISVIVDLSHRDVVLKDTIIQTGVTALSGKRISKGWAEEQILYFHIETSQPYVVEKYLPDNGEKILLSFPNLISMTGKKELLIKVGLSPVSYINAKMNINAEIPDWDFDRVLAQAESTWNKQLGKIDIQAPDSIKNIFYTALYHNMIVPNVYSDCNGDYRGMDKEVHNSEIPMYTVFSLWDTYRATHPLYTIIEQEKTAQFIHTFLRQYEQGGELPMWELASNYTYCMIGYHAVSVIADAAIKGIPMKRELALKAAISNANRDKLGGTAYKRYNVVPAEEESESVSKTLEYSYDDYCVYKLCSVLRNASQEKYFKERAGNYRNVYNPANAFMQAKFNGMWKLPFDPYEVNSNYTEANAWQYQFYVPHDISGLIELHGGAERFEKNLDAVFSASEKISGRQQVDMTGKVGQYVHGNEPSHHMPYLYQYVFKPHKTADYLNEIMETKYSNKPDGLSGNEDCGQMSAWYVFTALGFYPVCPASNEYVIGKPFVERATINLENGRKFRINTKNYGKKYIEKIILNGKEIHRFYLKHSEIVRGGNVEFVMTDRVKELNDYVPPTSSLEYDVPSHVFVKNETTHFYDSLQVILCHAKDDIKIYYGETEEIVRNRTNLYTSPVTFYESGRIYYTAENKKGQSHPIIHTEVYKLDPDTHIRIKTPLNPQYKASGERTLIDGVRGKEDYRLHTWMGFQGEDIEIELSFNQMRNINKIGVGAIQFSPAWILFPGSIEVYYAFDSKSYQLLGEKDINESQRIEKAQISDFWLEKSFRAEKIKIIVKNPGKLPSWHLSDGNASWIFIDEILIDFE